jgi:hypothetical protein
VSGLVPEQITEGNKKKEPFQKCKWMMLLIKVSSGDINILITK